MLKKLALLLILLLPAFASQAFSVTISSITAVRSVFGTCAAGDLLIMDLSATFAGTVDDGGNFDRFTFVLYDANGTPISLYNGTFTVGLSVPVSSMNFPLQAAPQSRPLTLNFFDTPSSQSAATAANYPLILSITFDPADYGVCASLPTNSPSSDDAPQFHDGRLNRFDMAAPFVVFGHEFQDGSGLVVYSPDGSLLLAVSPDEIAVECTGETIELASDNGVTLYLLPSCEYQMMARSLDGAKNYVLIFSELSPNASYRSYEE